MHQLIVRTYKAKSQASAAKAFSQDAKTLADQGYIVVLQSWKPGKTGWPRFLLTLSLSAWMFKPTGSVTVTYRLELAPNAPKPRS